MRSPWFGLVILEGIFKTVSQLFHGKWMRNMVVLHSIIVIATKTSPNMASKFCQKWFLKPFNHGTISLKTRQNRELRRDCVDFKLHEPCTIITKIIFFFFFWMITFFPHFYCPVLGSGGRRNTCVQIMAYPPDPI